MKFAYRADTLKALVDSLRFDPFYSAISREFETDEVRRREALAHYFDYSMSEGAYRGRLAIWPDPAVGAAVWLLPLDRARSEVQSQAKASFLADALGMKGSETYHQIVDFMTTRALDVIAKSAWYLSIVGIAPSAQGQGIGARLLEPTLAEADAAAVTCYLETFDSRNPIFYRRLGFSPIGTHIEPSTGSAYTIMIRPPKTKMKTLDTVPGE